MYIRYAFGIAESWPNWPYCVNWIKYLEGNRIVANEPDVPKWAMERAKCIKLSAEQNLWSPQTTMEAIARALVEIRDATLEEAVEQVKWTVKYDYAAAIRALKE